MRLKSILIVSIISIILAVAGIASAIDGFDDEVYFEQGPADGIPGEFMFQTDQPPIFQQQQPSPTGAEQALYFQQAPSSEQGVLLSYDVGATPPTSIYTQQGYVPWQTFSQQIMGWANPGFWISTSGGWTWYASTPLGTWVRELMYLPRSGYLRVYEIYPGNTIRMYNFGYARSGYNYIWFYGDVRGPHTSLLTVGNTPSNAVTVNVY